MRCFVPTILSNVTPRRVIVAAIIFSLFAPLAYADEVEVAYKTFYSHVRKLDSEDTQALQFAFGFQHIHSDELCTINAARISTQKQQLALDVSEENRFVIQSERALRMADAKVIIDFEQASNTCDISVQLETKADYLKQSYTLDELNKIYQNYQAFFNEMGGFMSFMMPQVDGLTFQFADKTLSRSLSNGMRIENGLLRVEQSDLSMLDRIRLPVKPMRITAKTSKS
jgi:hypothetical protein